MRRLLDLWRLLGTSQKRGYFGYAILYFLASLLSLLPGPAERFVLMRLEAGNPVGAWLVFGALALLSARLLPLAGGFLHVAWQFTVQTRLANLLRSAQLKALLDKPVRAGADQGIGSTLNHFREDDDEVASFAMFPPVFLTQVVTVIIVLTTLFALHWRLALGVLIPFFGVVALARLSNRIIGRRRAASRSSTGNLSGFVADVFQSVQAVQAAGAEKALERRFRELNDARANTMVADAVFSQAMRGVYQGISIFGTAALLLLAALLPDEMRPGIGDLALFQSYLMRLSWAPMLIGQSLNSFRQFGVSTDRLSRRFGKGIWATTQVTDDNEESEQIDETARTQSTATSTSIIAPDTRSRWRTGANRRVHRFTHTYPATGFMLECPGFALPEAGLMAITGQIGSGKTTLLKGMLGHLPGKAGLDWPRFPAVSYTSQLPGLFSGSLEENILLGAPRDAQRLARVLSLARFEADLKRLPLGLATPVGHRGYLLSGGQRQRLAIARMLYRDAPLHICDDISSALDATTETALWDALLAEERGFLVVTTRRELLLRADQVLVLEAGQVTGCGSPRRLLESHACFQKLSA